MKLKKLNNDVKWIKGFSLLIPKDFNDKFFNKNILSVWGKFIYNLSIISRNVRNVNFPPVSFSMNSHKLLNEYSSFIFNKISFNFDFVSFFDI